MPALIRFDQIAGVPVHYARDPVAPYGGRGKPRYFKCQDGFLTTLNSFFSELWEICPLGHAQVITSAGAYVEKAGQHGRGRAFDIDGLFWPDYDFVTFNFHSDPAFYLAVEALLHGHFGTVLAFHYNKDHRDHFHVDDGRPVGLRKNSRSHALFVQTAARYVFAIDVEIDGRWGPDTSAAFKGICESLNIVDDISAPSDWRRFLHGCAERAFDELARGGQEVAADPLVALRDVYDVIGRELGESTSRKAVEAALTAFVSMDEISDLLDQCRSG